MANQLVFLDNTPGGATRARYERRFETDWMVTPEAALKRLKSNYQKYVDVAADTPMNVRAAINAGHDFLRTFKSYEKPQKSSPQQDACTNHAMKRKSSPGKGASPKKVAKCNSSPAKVSPKKVNKANGSPKKNSPKKVAPAAGSPKKGSPTKVRRAS